MSIEENLGSHLVNGTQEWWLVSDISCPVLPEQHRPPANWWRQKWPPFHYGGGAAAIWRALALIFLHLLPPFANTQLFLFLLSWFIATRFGKLPEKLIGRFLGYVLNLRISGADVSASASVHWRQSGSKYAELMWKMKMVIRCNVSKCWYDYMVLWRLMDRCGNAMAKLIHYWIMEEWGEEGI